MSFLKLDTSIEFLKGVGPKKADVLRSEAKIRTYHDLLDYFPYKYVDRSKIYLIRDLKPDMEYIQVQGQIIQVEDQSYKRGGHVKAKLKDETGIVELIWFRGAKWIKKSLQIGKTYLIYGKPTVFNQRFSFSHPEMTVKGDPKAPALKGLQPMYPTSEKMKKFQLDSNGMKKLTQNLLMELGNGIPENLSEEIITDLKLLDRKTAYRNIHWPVDEKLLSRAKARLKFEEFFFKQMEVLLQKEQSRQRIKGHVFQDVGERFYDYYQNYIPFELTGAQKRVIKEIRKDCAAGQQMNRLLQGDVGSGKTLVAFLCALLAIDNGYQCALMAPTEILANQHFESLSEEGDKIGVNVQLLTGSTKKKDREKLFEDLANGQVHLLIGTHALIEDPVVFGNLGLVIIDEQHRFGVAQRAKLWRKNDIPPHVLVMTATPIPRTLAMTLYGDLDVSIIDELPPGRKPIKTLHRFDASRAELVHFLRAEIKKGRQVYIVYPLIEESEKLDFKNLMEGYEFILAAFPRPEYQVSIVHGKQKAKDKDFEMKRFAEGTTQIMVATTVIEVGVNVPNASVMVIESAEKFGLAQLHQLRGRVGRGAEQSYCILMTKNKLTPVAKKRMKTMVDSNDGFKIAEVDMELRGPGDIKGTQQSGIMNFKIADLVADQNILRFARQKAIEIVEEDPFLRKPENLVLKTHLQANKDSRINWSRIS